MLHHRTDGPGTRAWHIDERAAEPVYHLSRDSYGGVFRVLPNYDGWSETLQREYIDGVKELAEAAALSDLDEQRIT